ncbi:MAG: ankyrin repeat domain-containing protein [Bacteroidota bacterium]
MHTFEQAVQAIIHGEADRLRQLLDQEPNLIQARANAKHRASLLHYVSANGVEDALQRTPPNACEIAEIVLSAGADANATASMYSDNQDTALDLLVSSFHPFLAGVQADLVEVYVRHGANINGLRGDGAPLGLALANGYRRSAERLAALGARVDNLYFAAGIGLLELVQDYVKADGTCIPTDGDIPHNPRSQSGAFGWPPPNAKDPRIPAFIVACYHGRLAVAQYLLQTGLDVNASASFGQTALHFSCLTGQMDIVRWLVAKGADTQAADQQFGKTPKQWAEWGNEAEIAAFLTV